MGFCPWSLGSVLSWGKGGMWQPNHSPYGYKKQREKKRTRVLTISFKGIVLSDLTSFSKISSHCLPTKPLSQGPLWGLFSGTYLLTLELPQYLPHLIMFRVTQPLCMVAFLTSRSLESLE